MVIHICTCPEFLAVTATGSSFLGLRFSDVSSKVTACDFSAHSIDVSFLIFTASAVGKSVGACLGYIVNNLKDLFHLSDMA